MNTSQYLRKYGITLTKDSGQEIERHKDGFYNHTGIVMGYSPRYREKIIFHNHPDTGPALVTQSHFENGYTSYYTNRERSSYDSVLLRSFIQAEQKKNYDLITYNCHHASSISRTGRSESHGVRNTAIVAGLLLFFGGLK